MTFALVLAAGLVAYGTAINLVPPPDRIYLLLNIAAGAIVVTAASATIGAGPAQLGLAAPRAGATAAALAVVAAAAVAVPALLRLGRRSPPVAGLLSDGRVRGLDRTAVVERALLRIPVGTAAFEEVAFRGALLAAFSEALTVPAAVLASSVAFGLWHLAPTWRYLEANRVRERAVPLALAVVATTAAGAGLCVLRLASGGLLLPWAVHAAVNGGGLVAAHLHQAGQRE